MSLSQTLAHFIVSKCIFAQLIVSNRFGSHLLANGGMGFLASCLLNLSFQTCSDYGYSHTRCGCNCNHNLSQILNLCFQNRVARLFQCANSISSNS